MRFQGDATQDRNPKEGPVGDVNPTIVHPSRGGRGGRGRGRGGEEEEVIQKTQTLFAEEGQDGREWEGMGGRRGRREGEGRERGGRTRTWLGCRGAGVYVKGTSSVFSAIAAQPLMGCCSAAAMTPNNNIGRSGFRSSNLVSVDSESNYD